MRKLKIFGLGFLIGFVLVVLGAAMASAQQLAIPGYPTGEQACSVGTANQLVCGRFLAPYPGITNATKLAIDIRTGFGGSIGCSAGVWPDTNGGNAIVAVNNMNCGAQGVVFQTGLTAFSLTPGITYRVCFCAQGTSGAYGCPQWVSASGFPNLQNAFVVSVGTAANSCLAGVTPSTTGALSGLNTVEPPTLLLSVE